MALHLKSAEVFYRLYKDGVTYYANEYCSSAKKRNDTICSYVDHEGKVCFVQIELFV